MQKRLAPLVLTSLATATLPFFWSACGAPHIVAETKVAAVEAVKPPSEAAFHTSVQPFIQDYCVKCHGGKTPEAELDLSSATSVAAIKSNPARWNLVLERVRDREMPPDDAEKQPTAAQREPFVHWLESARAYETHRTAGDPGIVLARRLSNAEYDYTIRDLTGADIRPTKEFPVDPANEAGFDNSGESLAMSPALVKKYLDAARSVADHLVFTPDGLTFAAYPATTSDDRGKFAVNRVVDFYKRQGVSIANRHDNYMAQNLDYAEYFAAAWRYQHRAQLAQPNMQLTDFAKSANLSPKYLATLWSSLNAPAGAVGPMAAIQTRWKNLPAPVAGKEPEALRTQSVALRDFILELRPMVKMQFANLVPNGRIVATGSQTMVLWKNRQFAENRTNYAGNALTVDLKKFADADPAMAVPEAAEARAVYEDGFKRFCAVFPDAFAVYERARMYLSSEREILSDLEGHRLLTAGFHSQMGYFRDDRPLYDLVLNPEQQREIDRLWRELDFIADAPSLQFNEFIWYERAEPPSLMVNPAFASFRAEDSDLTSEPKLKRLAEIYTARVENMVLHIPIPQPGGRRGGGGGGNNLPLNYTAPAPGTVTGPPPPGFTEFRLSPEAVQAIRDYFTRMNTQLRALEQAKRAAEPLHLKALVEFAEKAYRRSLTAAEREDTLAFYKQLRSQNLSHEDAIRDSVVGVLMSPAFTYRVDLPRKSMWRTAAAVQPLSDYELANRLSYFLWSSMPDQELLRHAAAGNLSKPEVLVAQARRMLQDKRVRGLATEFGGNWLDVRRFEEHNAVDRERFPTFTNELREAMFEEPVRFIVDLVQRNGSVLDFVYGGHTFVNPVLAKHYGMPSPTGGGWVRIDDAGKYQRGGLLPMAAFLTKNAPGLRTSPVKRGHWVVTKILGERIPPPPPNIPVLPTDETKLGDLTLRETLARHREDKSCASCHNKIDSFGLVFEGFGPVGEVRTTDLAGRPAEINAVFPDGAERTGLPGLQNYLRTKVEHEFLDNLCRKLMSYALGRGLLPSDDLVIESMIEKLAANGNRFDTIVEQIVTSKQFLNKRTLRDTNEGS